MPSDTTSPNLGLTEIATGNQANNWITTLNNEFFLRAEKFLTATIEPIAASGTQIFQGPELRSNIIDFRVDEDEDGHRTLNFDVTVNLTFTFISPNIVKPFYWFYNDVNNGLGTVYFQVASGTRVDVPRGINLFLIQGTTVIRV